MVRSLIAIFAGYVLMALGVVGLFAVVSGEISVTPQFLMIASVCNLAFATAGGYVAALLAGTAPLSHGLGLVGLASGMWVISVVSASGQEPLIFQILNWGLMSMGAMTGAYLRSQQQNLTPKDS